MSFTPVGMANGLGAPSRPMVGWGTGLVDFDNDGRLDVLVAEWSLDAPPAGPRAETSDLCSFDRNEGGSSTSAPARDRTSPRSEAVAEAARSAISTMMATSDVVIVHQNRGVVLLRNDSARVGSGLRLRLEGRTSNRSAIGATVIVTVGKETLTRTVRGGG